MVIPDTPGLFYINNSDFKWCAEKMAHIVPEVIGAPSPQGVVLVSVNNRPNADPKDKDSWYVPAHTPVFEPNRNTKDMYGVAFVTAYKPANDLKVAGVSVDGVYDVENQKGNSGAEGINRFSIAVGGVVTVACTQSDANQFAYGDVVYVNRRNDCQVERLQDTSFEGAMKFTNAVVTNRSLGTFVGPVGKWSPGLT